MNKSGGAITVTLSLDDKQFNTAAVKADSTGKSLGSSLDKNVAAATKRTEDRFESLRGVASTTLKALGAGTVAAGIGSVKMAADYESAFAGVRKTVDATEAEFAQLSTGIRNMAKELPASASEIAAVAEAAGQLGIKTENILGFTRVMTNLGVATNLSADQAATALARLANITGMNQKDFDRLGSSIVALGNNFATTESEIVDMSLRLAGAGKQVGLSEAQITGFAAALSSVGIEAEAGGSAFSKVMVQMQLAAETGGESLNDFAKVAGMSADQFKNKFKTDAAGAIQDFIKGLSTAESRGTSAIKVLDDMGISEVRLRDSLLRASGASGVFSDAIETSTKAWEENTALTKEAEERYKTFDSQMAIFKNKLADIGIQIGTKVLPALNELVKNLGDGLQPAFDWLSTNGETVVKVITGIGVAFATIRIAGVISDFAKAEKTLALFVGAKNANGIKAIGAAFSGIKSGVTSAAKAIAGVATTAATTAKTATVSGLSAAKGWVTGAAQAALAWTVNAAKMVASMAATAATSAIEAVKAGAAWIANAVKMAATWVAQTAVMAARSFWLGFSQQAPAAAAALAWVASAIQAAAAWVAQTAVMVAQAVWAGAQTAAQAVIAGASWVAQAAQSALAWATNLAQIVGGAIANAASIAAQGIKAAASWLAQPVKIAAAWVANMAKVAATAVTNAVKTAAQALVAGGAWVKQAALAAGAWLLNFAKMLPFMIGTAAGMVVQAGIAAAAWIAGAVATAAAWVVANAAMLGVWGLIIAAVVGAVALIIANWESVVGFFTGIFDGIKNAVNFVIEWVKQNWPLLLAILTGPIGIAAKLIMDNWETVKAGFAAAWEFIKGIWSGVTGFFGGIGNGIKNIFNNVVDGIKNAFNGAVNFVRGIPGAILGALGNAGNMLYNFGRDMINGLINGAKSLLVNIGQFFLDILPGWIKEPFAKAMGIHSPSRVFAGYGKNTVEGFVEGVEDNASMAMKVASDLANDIIDAGDPGRGDPKFDGNDGSLGTDNVGGGRGVTQINNNYTEYDTDKALSDLAWKAGF